MSQKNWSSPSRWQRATATGLATIMLSAALPGLSWANSPTAVASTAVPSAAGNNRITKSAATKSQPATSSSAVVASKITLEEAINRVKQTIIIPATYTHFTSGYTNDDTLQGWSLQWTNPSIADQYLSASVNAQTGEITYLEHWKNTYRRDGSQAQVNVTVAEAEELAQTLLQRLAGQRVQQLERVPIDPAMNIQPGNMAGSYEFQWRRIANGLPFADNGVTISINSEDSYYLNYRLNWTEGNVPSPKPAVTPERARKIVDDNRMLQLNYQRIYDMRPMTTGQMPKVILAYRFNHPSGGIIDADSGEPIQNHQGFYGIGKAEGGMGMGASITQASSNDVPPLTEQEIKELTTTASLISQEQAIRIVKRWAPSTQKASLRSANLNSVNEGKDRVWYLMWETSGSNPQSVSARVDATTGELLGLDINDPENQKNTKQLSETEARKVAEDFLQSVAPAYFKDLQLENTSTDSSMPRPTNHSFFYKRLVNGIVYQDNYAYVNVTNGKVVNYDLNWNKHQVFPSAQNILSQQKATDAYFKLRPQTLSYLTQRAPGQPTKIRLVYQPIADPTMPFFELLDAQTGKPLDWQGKPVQPGGNRFTDIQGHYGEKEIAFLGKANLFKEYGNSFRPDEAATGTAVLRALLTLKGAGEGMGATGTEEDILRQARELGLVKEDMNPADPLRRDVMAQLIVRYLGLDAAARYSDIFQVPYSDTALIKNDAVGHVIIASRLGIIRGNYSEENRSYGPGEQINRAQAAIAIYRAMNIPK
ncbi:YcdB/YcdC domain-containing protein [Heliophilum fasciatum]|uniref:S-layer family protein n=1 Tax=Heliophilum fasciatum TaxID=35700 RepID=A0A4R2RP94_9FIRM|nr:YcdB/YcdC domain-containing protein [Heliophilum fasciatum]MCW2278097.1 hypothetical protein [Heliophilum fasciatum]TCP64167.1 S-layer family protein [Heliophilum fasciatum]